MTELLRYPMPEQVVNLSDWALMSGKTHLRQGVEYYEELGILIVDKTDWPEGLTLVRRDGIDGVNDIIGLKEALVGAPVFNHGIEVVEVVQPDGFAYYVDRVLVHKDDYRLSEALQVFGFRVNETHAYHVSGKLFFLQDLMDAEEKEQEFIFQRMLESRK